MRYANVAILKPSTFAYLSDLSWVAIDEKSFAAIELLDHGFGHEVQDDKERDQVALFHDGIELFAHFRAGFDLITEEIA